MNGPSIMLFALSSTTWDGLSDGVAILIIAALLLIGLFLGYALRGLVGRWQAESIEKRMRLREEEAEADIDEKDVEFTECSGTKKGTVIKKCEVSGEEFECVWDEREVCTREGYDADLYNIKLKKVCTSSDIYEYMTVKDVEFLGERENVYNGTVAVYHNYFTVDENTSTIVNQLNCGE